MRPPFLALLPLALAVVLAPAAPVRFASEDGVEKKVAAKKASAASTTESESDTKDAPVKKQQDKRKDQKQKRAPERAQWCELTPVIPTGDGPVEDDVEPGLCPELAPALYARRLPVVLRFPEPPTEPDRVSLKSGHLSLPPPVA